MKNEIQMGTVLPFTATANVESGDLVRIGAAGNVIGVSALKTDSGQQGQAQIDGVFRVKKSTVAGSAITKGQAVNFLFATSDITGNTPGAGLGLTGVAFAVEDAGDSATEALVKLFSYVGTAT